MTSSADDRLERTLRPSPVTGVRVDPLLTSVLLAELLKPSEDIWLISAWVSDVTGVDNTRGNYDSLFGDAVARIYTLSEILGMLVSRGTKLTVVTRDVPENEAFLARLRRAVTQQGQLRIIRSPGIHEKTLCGDDWLLSGSMNFTFSGMNANDEAVTYKVDRSAAAAARVDFGHRWEDA